MRNIEDFYILGDGVDTDIGICEFIKVRDYSYCFDSLQLMGWSKQHIIYNYHKLKKIEPSAELDEFIDEIKKSDLYKIVATLPELTEAYADIFQKVFDNEEVLSLITDENFDHYRNLVLRMNCIVEEESNPNPEIQEWIDISKETKAQESDGITFADIISSVVTYAGGSFEEVKGWSMYQMYTVFHRIGHFKSYDTSTLFATVAEKVDIQSWCKSVDLFEKQKHSMTRSELSKKTKVFED